MPFFTKRTPNIQLFFYIASLLLLVVFCIVVYNRWLYSHVIDATAMNEAKQLRMKLAYNEGPLRLFVDEQFPERLPFKLYDFRQQLLLSERDLKQKYQNNGIKEVTLSLGMDFKLKCYFTIDDRKGDYGDRYLDRGLNLLELRMQKGNEIQYDLNADGIYDLRYTCLDGNGDKSLCKYAVWYENQWRDVADEDKESMPKYTKRLPDGSVLDFDFYRGQWVVGDAVHRSTIAPDVPDEENN